MKTIYFNGILKSTHIPSDIILRDREYATYEEDKIIYCCECMDYTFEVYEGKIYTVLKWVYEGVNGFSFFTYHPVNGEFLELLEKVRAINRCDGKANLLTLLNYEYSVWFRQENDGFVVDKFEPQDYSYNSNIPAFYDPDLLKNWLRERAIKYCRARNEHQIFLEFKQDDIEEGCSSFTEYYAPCIDETKLESEFLKYSVYDNTYRLCVDVGIITVSKDYVYVLWLAMETAYETRLKYNAALLNLFAEINAVKENGAIDVDGDQLYRAKFEILLRRLGSTYHYVSIRLQAEKADGYWDYLMHLAEAEQQEIEK